MRVSASIAIILLAAIAICTQAAFLSPPGSQLNECLAWGTKAYFVAHSGAFSSVDSVVPHYNETSLLVNYTLNLRDGHSNPYFVPLAVYCPYEGDNELVWVGRACC